MAGIPKPILKTPIPMKRANTLLAVPAPAPAKEVPAAAKAPAQGSEVIFPSPTGSRSLAVISRAGDIEHFRGPKQSEGTFSLFHIYIYVVITLSLNPKREGSKDSCIFGSLLAEASI